MFNTDWLLKRVLKAVLKRNIGRYLSSEIDLGQLDIDLGTGKLELKNVLLNCDVLNADLGDTGFLVKAGFLSSVRASLPALSSLTPGPCSVDVDDVLLMIVPKPGHVTDSPSAAKHSSGPNSPARNDSQASSTGLFAGMALEADLLEGEGGGLLAGAGNMLADAAGAAITDGIKRIAGRLQTLLAGLRISATSVKLRLELPLHAPPPMPSAEVAGVSNIAPQHATKAVVIMLRIASIAVTDQSAASASSSASAANPAHGVAPIQSQHSNRGGLNRVNSAQRGTRAAQVAHGGREPDQAQHDEIAKCVELHGVTLDVHEGAPLQVGFGGSSAARASEGNTRSSGTGPVQQAAPTAAAGSALKLVSAAGKQGVQARIVLRMTRGSVATADGSVSNTQLSVDAEFGSLLLTLSQAHGAALHSAATALQAHMQQRQASHTTGAGAVAVTAAVVAHSSAPVSSTPFAPATAYPTPSNPFPWQGPPSTHANVSSGVGAGSASVHRSSGYGDEPYEEEEEAYEQPHDHWSNRSMMESLLAPDCEGFLLHTLEPFSGERWHGTESASNSRAYGYNQPPAQRHSCAARMTKHASAASCAEAQDDEVFYDASGSSYGSMAGNGVGISSSGYGASRQHASAPGLGTHIQAPPKSMQTLSIAVSCNHAAVMLAYAPVTAVGGAVVGQAYTRPTRGSADGFESHSVNALQHQPSSCPHGSFVFDMHELLFRLQPSTSLQHTTKGLAGAAAYGGPGAGTSMHFDVGQLSACEQLPAGSMVSLGVSSEEAGMVPECLPQTPHCFRPRAVLHTAHPSSPEGPGTTTAPLASASPFTCQPALQAWPVMTCTSLSSPLEQTHGSAGHAVRQGTAVADAQHGWRHVPMHGHAHGHAQSCMSMHKGSLSISLVLPPAADKATHGSAATAHRSWDGGQPQPVSSGQDPHSFAKHQAPLDLAVDVKPVTLWLNQLLVDRLKGFAQSLMQGTGSASAAGHQITSPGSLAHAGAAVISKGSSGGGGGALPGASTEPWRPAPPGSLVAALSAPHICCIWAVGDPSHSTTKLSKPGGSCSGSSSSSTSSTHASSTALTTAPVAFIAVDIISGRPSASSLQVAQHLHGYASSYSHGVHATADIAPLLRVSQRPAEPGLLQQPTTGIDLAVGSVELHLLRRQWPTSMPASQPRSTAAGSYHTPNKLGPGYASQPHIVSPKPTAKGTPFSCSSILRISPPDAGANDPRVSGAANAFQCANAAGVLPQGARFGPDDVQPGCGMHVHVSLAPGTPADRPLASQAWDDACIHAEDRWLDAESGAWEDWSNFSSVEFQARCRKSSEVFVHIRSPNIQLQLRRSTLAALSALQPRPGPAVSSVVAVQPSCTASKTTAQPSGAAAKAAAELGPQTTVLAQVRVSAQVWDDALPADLQKAAKLFTQSQRSARSGPMPATTRPHANGSFGIANGPQRTSLLSHAQLLCYPTAVAFDFRIGDLTAQHVSNLGSLRDHSALSVLAHGFTLSSSVVMVPAGNSDPSINTTAPLPQAVRVCLLHCPEAGPRACDNPGLQYHRMTRPGATQSALHGAGPTSLAAIGSLGAVAAAAAASGTAAEHTQPINLAGNGGQGYASMHGSMFHDASSIMLSSYHSATHGFSSGSAFGNESGFFGRRPGPLTVSTVWPSSIASTQEQGSPPPFAHGLGFASEPVVVPEEVINSVLVRGLTLSTDYGYVTLDWLTQLGGLFMFMPEAQPEQAPILPAASKPRPNSAAAYSSTSTGTRGSVQRWAVNVLDLALRHDPLPYPAVPGPAGAAPSSRVGQGGIGSTSPGSAGSVKQHISPVAFALLVESLHLDIGNPKERHSRRSGKSGCADWRSEGSSSMGGSSEGSDTVSPITSPSAASRPMGHLPSGNATSAAALATCMQLHCVSVHVAAADARGVSWDAAAPQALRSTLLQSAGYCCVVQEAGVKVVVKAAGPRRSAPGTPEAASSGSAPVGQATGQDILSCTQAVQGAASLLPCPSIHTGPSAWAKHPPAMSASSTGAAGSHPAHQASPSKVREAESMQAADLDVEISNQQVMGILTAESAALLTQLAMQVSTLASARAAATATANSDSSNVYEAPRPAQSLNAMAGCGLSSALSVSGGSGLSAQGMCDASLTGQGVASGSGVVGNVPDTWPVSGSAGQPDPWVRGASPSKQHADPAKGPSGTSASSVAYSVSGLSTSASMATTTGILGKGPMHGANADIGAASPFWGAVDTNAFAARKPAAAAAAASGGGVSAAVSVASQAVQQGVVAAVQHASSLGTECSTPLSGTPSLLSRAQTAGRPLHSGPPTVISAQPDELAGPPSVDQQHAEVMQQHHKRQQPIDISSDAEGDHEHGTDSGMAGHAVGADDIPPVPDLDDVLSEVQIEEQGLQYNAAEPEHEMYTGPGGSDGCEDRSETDSEADASSLLEEQGLQGAVQGTSQAPQQQQEHSPSEAAKLPADLVQPQQRLAGQGIILIDDFFPINYEGENEAPAPTNPRWRSGIAALPGRPEGVCDLERGGTWLNEDGAVYDGASAVAGSEQPGGMSTCYAQSVTSAAPEVNIQEDYIRQPKRHAAWEAPGLHDPGILPPAGQPPPRPTMRITFNNISGIWVMHTSGKSPAPEASPGSGMAPGSLQEGRIELEVEGLSIVTEAFGPTGHLSRTTRVTVRNLEIRDCAPAPASSVGRPSRAASARAVAAVAAATGSSSLGSNGSGTVSAAAASGWTNRTKILSYRSAPGGRPRDSRAPLLGILLSAVRPDPANMDPQAEEMRLMAALLPLRIKLDQDVLTYLERYGATVSTAVAPAAAALAALQQAALRQEDPLPPWPYFQQVSVAGCSVLLDYRPRRVDVGALMDGSLAELINLVPIGGLDLSLVPLRLRGVQGWAGLGAAAAHEWLRDIVSTQKHKLVAGVAPINAVVKAGNTVTAMLAKPARQISSHLAGLPVPIPACMMTSMGISAPAPGSMHTLGVMSRSHAEAAFRTIRSSSRAFVRSLAAEALAAGRVLSKHAKALSIGGSSGSISSSCGEASSGLHSMRAAAAAAAGMHPGRGMELGQSFQSSLSVAGEGVADDDGESQQDLHLSRMFDACYEESLEWEEVHAAHAAHTQGAMTASMPAQPKMMASSTSAQGSNSAAAAAAAVAAVGPAHGGTYTAGSSSSTLHPNNGDLPPAAGHVSAHAAASAVIADTSLGAWHSVPAHVPCRVNAQGYPSSASSSSAAASRWGAGGGFGSDSLGLSGALPRMAPSPAAVAKGFKKMGRTLKHALSGKSAQGFVSSAASSLGSMSRMVSAGMVSAGMAAATSSAAPSAQPSSSAHSNVHPNTHITGNATPHASWPTGGGIAITTATSSNNGGLGRVSRGSGSSSGTAGAGAGAGASAGASASARGITGQADISHGRSGDAATRPHAKED